MADLTGVRRPKLGAFPNRRQIATRRSAGRDLYLQAVAQARSSELYARIGAPDTIEGRFELLTLHVILLIDRLKAEASASSQALFDAYLSNLDGALREMGVGDLTVGKRMRALGQAFYGRAKGYADAFTSDDRLALESLIVRTVGVTQTGAADLAQYILRCRAYLAGRSTEDLLERPLEWPAP